MKRFAISMMAAVMAVSAGAAQAAEKVSYLFPAPDFLPAFAPFQLAKHKGYFADEGLDVTFMVGKGGADVATQVAVGNADIGGGIGDTPIIVRANGLKIRGVALLGGRGLTQLAWRKDSGITGPADFKGKAIGVLGFQDTTYYNLLGAMASVGLTKNDVNIQGVGPGGIIQLTIAGTLQGMSGVPEWIAAVEAAGVPMDQVSVDTMFPAMAQAILASDETIAERPEVVKGIVARRDPRPQGYRSRSGKGRQGIRLLRAAAYRQGKGDRSDHACLRGKGLSGRRRPAAGRLRSGAYGQGAEVLYRQRYRQDGRSG